MLSCMSTFLLVDPPSPFLGKEIDSQDPRREPCLDSFQQLIFSNVQTVTGPKMTSLVTRKTLCFEGCHKPEKKTSVFVAKTKKSSQAKHRVRGEDGSAL